MTMLEVPGLPPLDELEDEDELRDLVRFIPRLSSRYEAPVHLTPLLRRFELAVQGVPQRVCCSAPPRHAKTESVLHVPAYGLRMRPELRFSYSTYADRLSRSKSRKARTLALAAGVSLESTSLNEWRTAEGGGLLAGGVGGPLTGHGVDILLVDDPVKNRVEAESKVYRERLLDWWRDVAATRIEPGGSAFVFMTRWHPDDLIGTLVSEGFEYINLPAISEGRALWPSRWPLEALERRREDVGPYTWASLYQGEPRPRGDRVFSDAHVFEELPYAGILRFAFGLDLAASERTSADWSVLVKMARCGDEYFILDVIRRQELSPAFKRRVHAAWAEEPSARVRWYAAGMERAAAGFYRDGEDGIPLRDYAPEGDKFTRAIPFSAAWAAGKVKVPRRATWLKDFLEELYSFTGSGKGNDDQVDAAVAAFDELASGAAREDVPNAPAVPTRAPPLRSVGM